MASPGTLSSTSIQERAPSISSFLYSPHRCLSLRARNFLQVGRQMVVCGLNIPPPSRCKITSKVT